MKAMYKAMLAVGVAGVLAGCSGAPVKSDVEIAADRGLDLQKIAAVNAAAKKTGVRVYWVNPPTKQN